MLRHHLAHLWNQMGMRNIFSRRQNILSAAIHFTRTLLLPKLAGAGRRVRMAWRERLDWRRQMPHKHGRWLQAGHSLPELLIALAIGLILLTQALPEFNKLLRDTKLSTSVNQFIAAQSFARTEAIQRGKPVTVCRSVRADQGRDECSLDTVDGHGPRDWAAGWLVFVENGAGNLGQVDAEDEILARQGTLHEGGEGDATATAIIWGPQGVPLNIAGARVQFSWDGKQQRVLCISRAGRTRVLRDVDRCA
ncbi:GspH/FimT family pseudopilin [Massilia sp. W12]|uniref:GspH/FimT family pseudopilin n=1 Tax=Massilia sp. W12 TaxID=3126507 RepID=UPI0030CB6197